MVTLARSLETGPTVYAGFSAGGLAALIAATKDASASGVVALDLVEDGGLGARAARELDKPLIGLMGEPSACNADGNGMSVLAAARSSEVERVRGAGHCDFESPTSRFCELVCGRTTASRTLRRGIIESAVSAAADLLGSESRGA
jgi:pimeloyl-ACP methyl ester carboxylesterase